MICDRIRALREGTGKSARKFAEEIGVKYTTYYGYETGSREPGSDTLVALAKYYNVTTDYILGIEKTPVPAEADTGKKVDAMEVYQHSSIQMTADIYTRLQASDALSAADKINAQFSVG